MENYTIAEDFILPSKGKLYTDKSVNPNVKLRSMTTIDEMRRLRPNERQYKSLAEVIDSCIVDDIGISAYDMCVADFQFLLHKLRTVTYGPDYKLKCTCPYCFTSQDETISLDDLEYRELSDISDIDLEFDLPVTQNHILLRLQTPRLLDDISLATKVGQKRNQGNESGSAFLYTLKHLVKEVNEEKVDPIWLEDFLKNLPMKDTNFLLNKSRKAADAIGLVPDITILCNVCGLAYTSPFRITSEFFGPEI